MRRCLITSRHGVRWVLANAEAQIEYCVEELRSKRLHIRDVAVAFDWHVQPYYGKLVPGMVGTQPKRGTCYAFSFLTATLSRLEGV